MWIQDAFTGKDIPKIPGIQHINLSLTLCIIAPLFPKWLFSNSGKNLTLEWCMNSHDVSFGLFDFCFHRFFSSFHFFEFRLFWNWVLVLSKYYFNEFIKVPFKWPKKSDKWIPSRTICKDSNCIGPHADSRAFLELWIHVGKSDRKFKKETLCYRIDLYFQVYLEIQVYMNTIRTYVSQYLSVILYRLNRTWRSSRIRYFKEKLLFSVKSYQNLRWKNLLFENLPIESC